MEESIKSQCRYSLAGLIIFPFLPFMIHDFFPDTPYDQLGFAAGILASSFHIGGFVGSYYVSLLDVIWLRLTHAHTVGQAGRHIRSAAHHAYWALRHAVFGDYVWLQHKLRHGRP